MSKAAGDMGQGRLEQFRSVGERILLALLWALGPVIAGLDWLSDDGFGIATGLWGVSAAMVTLMAWLAPGSIPTRMLLGVAMAGQPAIVLFELAGHPWQADIHMAFFAVVAVMGVLACVHALLAATATVALHHLVLNFVASDWVYPGGPDLGRVVLHAVILLAETGTLCWMVLTVARLIASETVAQAQREAEARAKEEREQALAEAVARREADRVRREALERLTESFTAALNQVRTALSGASARMETQSAHVLRVAARSGELARSTNDRVRDAATDLGKVAAATEEMTASIQEITRQVAGAATTAQAVATRARETEGAMGSLSDAASRIGDVARLISDIAGQTNLLALNATIEAARAGDAGKGFAVVAGEVKNLAGSTAHATQEIGSHITAIQGATHDAVAAVRLISDEIHRMEDLAAAIANAMQQQGEAVREISSGVATVAHATQDAAVALNEAAAVATEVQTSSGDVSEIAAQVGAESDTLGLELEEFLSRLRSDITRDAA